MGAAGMIRRAGLVLAALGLLLAATLVAAYLPLGPLKLPVALAIASGKAALVVLIFMEQTRAGPAARLALAAGLLWLGLLLGLTFADEGVRQRLPPGFHTSMPAR